MPICARKEIEDCQVRFQMCTTMINPGNCRRLQFVLGRYVSVRYFHSVRWHNLCFNAYHLGINRAVTPISLLSSSWELLLPRSSSRIWLFSLSLKYFFGCVLYFNSALRREASTSLRLTHPFCPATSACLISFELVGQGDQTKPKVTWFQFLLEVIREILWHICAYVCMCRLLIPHTSQFW